MSTWLPLQGGNNDWWVILFADFLAKWRCFFSVDCCIGFALGGQNNHYVAFQPILFKSFTGFLIGRMASATHSPVLKVGVCLSATLEPQKTSFLLIKLFSVYVQCFRLFIFPTSDSGEGKKLETSQAEFKSHHSPPTHRWGTYWPECHRWFSGGHADAPGGPLLLCLALIGISCVDGCERRVEWGHQRGLLIRKGHFTRGEHSH